MSTPTPYHTGAVLGAYTLGRTLGSGGMATVFEAHHAALGRTVAVKLVHPHLLAGEPGLTARFAREAQIIASLDHPHIVPVYDFAEHNDQPFLVLKLVRGHTLRALLYEHNGAPPLELVLRVARAVGAALDAAHARGVLHRDIKPTNVLVEGDTGHIYLTDFGLARVLLSGESSLSRGMIVGTPAYMAPEQAAGREPIGAAADVYAFGILLYEMIVGSVPFNAESPYAVVHDHIATPAPFASDVNPAVPRPVAEVLARALAKQPHDRYPSAGALAQALEAALDASGVQALPPDRAAVASQRLAAMRAHDAPPADAEDAPAPSVPAARPGRRTQVEAVLDFGKVSLPRMPKGDTTKDDAPRRKRRVANRPAPYAPPDEATLRRRAKRRLAAEGELRQHQISYVMVNIVLTIGYFVATGIARSVVGNDPIAQTALSQPWPLFVLFAWGGGLAAHWSMVRAGAARNEARRAREVGSALAAAHGPDWAATIDQDTFDRVQRTIERRDTRRAGFRAHLATYLMVNAGFLFAWYVMVGNVLRTVAAVGNEPLLITIAQAPMTLVIALFWGIGLVSHSFEAHRNEDDETALARALDQERSTVLAYSTPHNAKRKHVLGGTDASSVHARLADDGELTDSVVARASKR